MPVITYFEDDDGDNWDVSEGRLRLNGNELADAREFSEWLQSELAKDAPAKPDDDGWIDWEGGKCPVDEGDLVDVTTRNDVVSLSRTARHWDWQHNGHFADIMRYRPAKGGEA